jgi:hypothetical protein
MDIAKARAWLVKVSLLAVALIATFLILAPAVGYPLRFDQSLRLLESSVPTFLGLIGSAAIFLVQDQGPRDIAISPAKRPLLGIVTRGPIVVFGVISVASFVGFSLSNRASAQSGSGMSVNDLAHALTFANGLLALTTNAISVWLFRVEAKHEADPARS